MALLDSEACLKAAQELAHVGSWQWDLRTGMFSMSDEMLRIHGLPPGDPPADVQAVVESAVHPDDRAMMRSAIEDVLAGGEGQAVSCRIVRPDGEIRWVAATKHTVRQRAEDGSPVALMGTVQDVTEQRTAQIALQQSEEKYRAVVENIGEAIATINADGVFLFTNTTGAERYGTTPEDLVDKTLWDLFPKQFADKEAARARQVIVSGQSSTIELLVPTGEEMRWHAVSMEPVRDHDGEVRSALIIARDIHEHRTARIALQQSEEKYRAVVESAGEAICRLSAAGVFLFMNVLGAQRLGSTPDEVVGKTLWDVFPEEFANQEATRVREAIASGKGSLIETLVPLGNEMRWYQISMEPVRDHDGEVRSALIIARDVTERKQAEEWLRQSELRYRTLFEGANEGIMVVDLETRRIMFANPAVCRMFKYSDEELLEMRVEDCHRPEDLAYALSEFQALARGDRKTSLAIPCRTRDGEVVYADIRATVIHLEGRDCMVGFFHDLTDARQAEEALKAAHTKLMTARDEERKHLASELHDSVSQKLVALGMRLDNIALTGAKLPAEQGSELVKAAVTCNELIADIKGICHGLYPPALEALGLVSAMKELEGYCQSAGLTAAIHCDPVIAQTRFGPEVEIALFRIAQEAVNNAIRHSHGTNIDIDLMLAGGQLVLAIVDDGGGFDMQAVEGKGLGLSSMRDRARAVGARLTIASEPGETRIEVSVAVNLEETNKEKG
jgi:PAS domain S-box-containing protein